jgi:hypothetical protein
MSAAVAEHHVKE